MTDEHTTDRPRMYPALALMERECPPLRFGRPPYWRAPEVPASVECYVPSWNWASVYEAPEDAKTLNLDANGAYLGAIGTVKIAHSHLQHCGPWENLPEPRKVPPGYFLIAVPYWAFSGTIVSPLGDAATLQTSSAVWVAAPTLILLLELLEAGVLAEVTVLDSWIAHVSTDFRDWQKRLRAKRDDLLDEIERTSTDAVQRAVRARYDAFKEGYAAALSMMLTGQKCQTRRPDWTHHVLAEHRATQWRKAWRWTETGSHLVSMGHVDEFEILAEDLYEAMARPKPPFRYDPSGRAIGAMKPKPKATRSEPTRAAVLVDTTTDDIL